MFSRWQVMTIRIMIAAMILISTALAQSTNQAVLGLVSDSTGAVIQGAKVTLTNADTNVTQTVTTNETGNYSFPLIQVGNYDLRVEMAGFKTESVRNIRVETAAQVRQDIKLDVGNITESVEVSASAVQLNTENATLGAVVENRRITELPLNGRNMQNLAVLVPGVQYGIRTGKSEGANAAFPIPGQGFGVIANGIRETHQVVSLDGVDAKDPRIHVTNFVPSIEALEEFKIQTNAYSAENGFGGGAVVTITMKSGTNTLHGTFFDFLRNDLFDAENYFLNFELAPGATRLKKNTLRQNQFGFVLSGPVVIPKLYNGKNKTFWAFNYEGRRTREGQVATANFPIDPFRSGDFSALQNGYIANGRFVAPILIYDPDTGVPFPNNVIPRIADSSRRTQCSQYLCAACAVRSVRHSGFYGSRQRSNADERKYLFCAGGPQHQRQQPGLRASCVGPVESHAQQYQPIPAGFRKLQSDATWRRSGSIHSTRAKSWKCDSDSISPTTLLRIPGPTTPASIWMRSGWDSSAFPVTETAS